MPRRKRPKNAPRPKAAQPPVVPSEPRVVPGKPPVAPAEPPVAPLLSTPTELQVAPPPPAATFREMVTELSKMAADLESAWSEALDRTESLASAQEQIRGQLQSLTQVFVREVEADSAALRAAGFDPTLTFSNPMPDAQLREVALLDGPVGEFRRIAIARMLALQDFLTVTGAIFEKPNRLFREAEGWTDWWSSGAFELIRARAKLLLQLHEEAEAFTHRLASSDGPEVDRQMRSMLYHLDAARRLVVSAEPLAALAHQLAALRLRILASGDPTDEAIAAPVSVLAARCPSLAPIAEALGVAEQTIVKTARGDASDLATASVLAYQLHDRVVRAAMTPALEEYSAAITAKSADA
jgi:hypothetical protein